MRRSELRQELLKLEQKALANVSDETAVEVMRLSIDEARQAEQKSEQLCVDLFDGRAPPGAADPRTVDHELDVMAGLLQPAATTKPGQQRPVATEADEEDLQGAAIHKLSEVDLAALETGGHNPDAPPTAALSAASCHFGIAFSEEALARGPAFTGALVRRHASTHVAAP
jgi:hypothetical protein